MNCITIIALKTSLFRENPANVTLGHKTSHKGQFFEIEIYTSSESWINKLSIDVCLVEIQLFENLESEGAKQIKILRKSPLKLSKWSS